MAVDELIAFLPTKASRIAAGVAVAASGAPWIASTEDVKVLFGLALREVVMLKILASMTALAIGLLVVLVLVVRHFASIGNLTSLRPKSDSLLPTQPSVLPGPVPVPSPPQAKFVPNAFQLNLLDLLVTGKRTTAEIARLTGKVQPYIEHQLTELREREYVIGSLALGPNKSWELDHEGTGFLIETGRI